MVWLWTLTVILLLLGLAGTIVPGMPGIALVYGGILVFAFVTEFAAISAKTVVILGILAALAVVADYAGSAFGSKYGGGKKMAIAGTIVGTLVGMTVGPLGMFLGAFLGALLGAIYEGATGDKALRVATYSVIGILGAMVVQFFLALVMIITFFTAIVF